MQLRSSSRRSLRTARNRCTRTVASLTPSAWLTSAVVCSATWQSVNTVRWRSGSVSTAAAISCARSLDTSRCSGVWLAAPPDRFGVASCARRHRQRPPQPPRARLAQVEAPVHEDAREPDLERQVFAVARDVREHLHERVLHRLVGVVRIAQVLVRDPHGPALLVGHQFAEPLARGVAFAAGDERLDLGRQLRIPRQRVAERRRSIERLTTRSASEAFFHGIRQAGAGRLPRFQLYRDSRSRPPRGAELLVDCHSSARYDSCVQFRRRSSK